MKSITRRKLMGWLLTLAMVLGMSVTAWAEPAPVPYQAWDETLQKVVDVEGGCTDYIKVTGSITSWESSNWYVVPKGSKVTINNRIIIGSTVNLILCDGATLIAGKGIRVNENQTLNIYAQGNGTGKLQVTGSDSSAGIGGNAAMGGTVTIHGGNIEAIGGNQGAGIGGGSGGEGGTVTIYGGTVTATGVVGGAGIGGGVAGSGGSVTIKGGTVKAKGTGGSYASVGIGAGYRGAAHGALTHGEGISLAISDDNVNWTDATGDTSKRKKHMLAKPYIALNTAAPVVAITKAANNTETGVPQIGDTLTASPSPVNATPVTYEWYRGTTKIEDAEEAVYIVTVDDVGQKIHVIAKQEEGANGSNSAAVTSGPSKNTATVMKKTNTMETISVEALSGVTTGTDTGITVRPAAAGYEYAVVLKGRTPGSNGWRSAESGQEDDGLGFTGLNPGTEYDVFVRARGSRDTEPGKATKLTVTTDITVTINGDPAEGRKLIVNTTPGNPGAVTYEWYRIDNSAMPAAETQVSTGREYVPTGDDVGKTLKVRVVKGGSVIGSRTMTGTPVKTINEYISGLSSPATVTLEGPVTGSVTIPADKKVTLDLNGFTAIGSVTVAAKGGLTITDGTASKTGKVTGDVTNHGSLNVRGGGFDGSVTNDGGLIIYSGTFLGAVTNRPAEGSSAITILDGTFRKPVKNGAGEAGKTGNVYINGGTFDERPAADSKAISINGGRFRVDPTKKDDGTVNPNIKIADGYQVIESDDDGEDYPWTIGPADPGEEEPATYPPAITPSEHGRVTTDPENPESGDVVTITVLPDEGYELDTITVTDGDGKPVEVSKNEDGTYSYVQPEGKVTITPVFKQADTEPVPNRPFIDVMKGDWFYDAVYHCFDRNYFKGIDETHFAPWDTMTRAMFATVLYRMKTQDPGHQTGEEETDEGASQFIQNPEDGRAAEDTSSDPSLPPQVFVDVEPGQWYTDAVIWAAENRIIEGYGDGIFGTDDPVTREQMVTIFYRWEALNNGHESVPEDDDPADPSRVSEEDDPNAEPESSVLDPFSDAGAISDWARDAFIWAVGAGVIHGKDNGILDPQGTGTRAEVAQIVKNYDAGMKGSDSLPRAPENGEVPAPHDS